MQAAGLKEPVFEMTTFFRTIFYRSPEYALKSTTKKGTEKSTEKSTEKIIAAIKDNSSISAQQIAQLLDITSRAVEKHLSNLKNNGVLKRVGPDKGGHWEIKK